jgi:hypothetical protein
MTDSSQVPAAAARSSILHSSRTLGQIVLVFCVLGVALGAGSLLSTSNRNGADETKKSVFALVQVAALEPTILRERAVYSPEEFDLCRRTHAARIHSRPVLRAALKRDEVAGLELVKDQADPVQWLERELKVDLRDRSELIRIGMHGSDVKGLATIVNAVVHVYLDEFVSRERNQKARRVSELDRALGESAQSLAHKRESLRKLEQTLGVRRRSPWHDQMLLQQAGERDRRLLEVRLALAAANARTEKTAATREELARLKAQEKLLSDELKQINRTVAIEASSSSAVDSLREEIAREAAIQQRLEEEREVQRIELVAASRISRFQDAEVHGGE